MISYNYHIKLLSFLYLKNSYVYPFFLWLWRSKLVLKVLVHLQHTYGLKSEWTIALYECAREQFGVLICNGYKVNTSFESISTLTTHIALNQNELLPCEFLDPARNKRLGYNYCIQMLSICMSYYIIPLYYNLIPISKVVIRTF